MGVQSETLEAGAGSAQRYVHEEAELF